MDHIILRVLRMKWGRDKTCNLKGFKLQATLLHKIIKDYQVGKMLDYRLLGVWLRLLKSSSPNSMKSFQCQPKLIIKSKIQIQLSHINASHRLALLVTHCVKQALQFCWWIATSFDDGCFFIKTFKTSKERAPLRQNCTCQPLNVNVWYVYLFHGK